MSRSSGSIKIGPRGLFKVLPLKKSTYFRPFRVRPQRLHSFTDQLDTIPCGDRCNIRHRLVAEHLLKLRLQRQVFRIGVVSRCSGSRSPFRSVVAELRQEQLLGFTGAEQLDACAFQAAFDIGLHKGNRRRPDGWNMNSASGFACNTFSR